MVLVATVPFAGNIKVERIQVSSAFLTDSQDWAVQELSKPHDQKPSQVIPCSMPRKEAKHPRISK